MLIAEGVAGPEKGGGGSTMAHTATQVNPANTQLKHYNWSIEYPLQSLHFQLEIYLHSSQ